MKSNKFLYFCTGLLKMHNFCTICNLGWLSSFPTFHKKHTNSLKLLKYIFENSSPREYFWRTTKRKFEFSDLWSDSRYSETMALKDSLSTMMQTSWYLPNLPIMDQNKKKRAHCILVDRESLSKGRLATASNTFPAAIIWRMNTTSVYQVI